MSDATREKIATVVRGIIRDYSEWPDVDEAEEVAPYVDRILAALEADPTDDVGHEYDDSYSRPRPWRLR